ncbi:hypothetical protein [Delftia sp. WSY_7]|uniref:hypothetical protein n=1 Tax=Delftia sp. WSY_7 TaxID=3367202 RepID=UPI00370BB0D8
MFGFFLRFFIASLKLIGKIVFILAGAVFSGIANAFFSMINSDDGSAGEDGISAHPRFDHGVVDEATALQAYNEGKIDAFEMVYFNED